MSQLQYLQSHDGTSEPGSAHGVGRPVPRGVGSPRSTSLQWSPRIAQANAPLQPRQRSRVRPAGSPSARRTSSVHPPQSPSAPAVRFSADRSVYDDSELDDGIEEEQWPLPTRPIVQLSSGTDPRRSTRQTSRQHAPPHRFRESHGPVVPLSPRQVRHPSPGPLLQAYPPAHQTHRTYANVPRPSSHAGGQWTQHHHGRQQNPGRVPPSAGYGRPRQFPPHAGVQSIAEETESGSRLVRNALAENVVRASYASSDAILGYYTGDHDEVPMPSTAEVGEEQAGPVTEVPVDDPPALEPPREVVAIEEEVSRSVVRDELYLDQLDHVPEPTTLIRQASLGKKTKPTLMTVSRKDSASRHAPMPSGIQTSTAVARESPTEGLITAASISPRAFVDDEHLSDDTDSDPEYESANRTWSQQSLLAGGAAALASALSANNLHHTEEHSQQPAMFSNTDSQEEDENIFGSGTALRDPSPAQSEAVSDRGPKRITSRELLSAAVPIEQQRRSRPRSPLAPTAVDPAVQRIVRGLEESGAITPEEALAWTTYGSSAAPRASLATAATDVRPSIADAEKRSLFTADEPATTSPEVRSSLTSLPDLIRRATKLAHNLDRGRTASRLGLNWFDGADFSAGEGKRRSGNSMSDMMSSFPAPGASTADLAGGHRASVMSRWSSSNARHSALPSVSDADEAAEAARDGTSRRRCCRCLPRWATALLVVLVILLVATAIAVPLVLAYGPMHRHFS